MQRQRVMHMLQDWNTQFPGRIETMFSALQNIVSSHMADPKAFNFVVLATQNTEYTGGYQAFDLMD